MAGRRANRGLNFAIMAKESSAFDLNSHSLSFVEELYEQYLRDPNAVDSDWREYFAALRRSAGGNGAGIRTKPSFKPRSVFNPAGANGGATGQETDFAALNLQDRVDQFIRAYRVRGHMIAELDPLGLPRPDQPELSPSYYGFTEADLDRTFSTNTINGPEVLTLRQIVERMENTYCRSIGVQFMHIDDMSIKFWLQERMEGTENHLELSRDEQLRILTRLTDATIFEDFIQKKFIGAKSFSLEGAESLIPLLDLGVEKAGAMGIDEIVVAMAHRGRLNVLVNVIGKSARQVFREFEDNDPELYVGGGDVKYHLGYHSDWETAAGRSVHLALCFNPSHLEFVNPVAMGRVRAKQDRMHDVNREKYMCLLIHGDAAFAGEGIVQESLNLSELDGYKVGGTLHIVVNNQIGFTTTPNEGRSSTYATDVAKMLQIPILHVNGEDPEAVAQAIHLAMEFRQRFRRDVIIDMYCYRRRGHNESDEPSFTQPIMYRAIEERPGVRRSYLERLLKLGGVTGEEADKIAEERRKHLEDELAVVRTEDKRHRPSILGRVWRHYKGGPESNAPEADTGVDTGVLSSLLNDLTKLPKGFNLHPKMKRGMDLRLQMAAGEKPLDWAACETLAFATLATEGTRIRMSGQDSARGTFSHRHAVLTDYETAESYVPLNHLTKDQGPVEIINSPLSEAGVLGFEYGYSIAYPDGLVLWEAQFGDFVNGAQVIIDQFITSAEDKWKSLSGVVMLLPHGFEGMGPEHSSARLERFLTLAAEDNIQVTYPSTPAQYFHLLRRQVVRPWRKPLVVMTPKSMLRHPEAVSSLDDLATGRFQRVIGDVSGADPAKVERILLCSGKIYYELDRERRELGRNDVAIVRVEQFYPLSDEALAEALAPYRDGTPVYWVQEEPENMGAWPHMHNRFCANLVGRFPFHGITRPESASPATGSASSHKIEQKELITEAFGDG